MGRLIEKSLTTIPMSNEEIVEALKTMLFGAQAFERFNVKERETLDKAWNIIDQYETRLKADLEAILVELQLEIEKFMGTISPNYDEAAQDIVKVIQQKINSLKAEREGKEAADGQDQDGCNV